MNKKKNNKKINKEKGFVVLVAVVISTLLVSIGVFIANVAYKEIRLSTSAKDSLQAFYAADSAIECALFHDFKDYSIETKGPFPRNKDDWENGIVTRKISCNGKESEIKLESSSSDTAMSSFIVSFVREQQSGGTEDNSPYAKVVITKIDIGGANDTTIIQAYGHNKKSGAGIVERAIKVTY